MCSNNILERVDRIFRPIEGRNKTSDLRPKCSQAKTVTKQKDVEYINFLLSILDNKVCLNIVAI